MMNYLKTNISKSEVDKMSTLAIAYVGDAVYEMCTRIHVFELGNLHSLDMHKASVKLVNANAQSEASEKILPLLNDDELSYFKRGRNSKVNSVPKRSSVKNYHLATGLETLFGYLYLTGQQDRINELYSTIIKDEN